MQHLQLDNTFWQFALSLYAKPGVAEKLLHLQDQFGLDINVLLYLAWCGEQNLQLTSDDIKVLLLLAQDWQTQVMRPLRAARREIRQRLGDGELYKKAKTLELSIEQEIIARMYALTISPIKGGGKTADDNIVLYLKAIDKENCPQMAQYLNFYCQ